MDFILVAENANTNLHNLITWKSYSQLKSLNSNSNWPLSKKKFLYKKKVKQKQKRKRRNGKIEAKGDRSTCTNIVDKIEYTCNVGC